jgi:hypothetical protein
MNGNDNDELNRLIAAFMDGTLDEQGRADFERRLREDPGVVQQTGEAVRFDMELADAMRPDHLEIVQQRRMVIDRATGQALSVETSDRVARTVNLAVPARDVTPAAKPKSPWLGLAIIAAILAGGGIWWATRKQDATTAPPASSVPVAAPVWVSLPLKNPGFELPDLGPPPASIPTPPDWRDKYASTMVSQRSLPVGEAHGGKQVAWLLPGSHMKQLLYDPSGKPVVFEPGRKLRISGWVKPETPVSGRIDGFHLALHYVDDRLLQYVVRYHVVPIDGSGWRKFSVEMTVPPQEVFEPSYTNATNMLTTVTGRPMLLSITNISAGQKTPVTFLLDDMEVELMQDAK